MGEVVVEPVLAPKPAARPARDPHPLRNPRIAGPLALVLLAVQLPFLHAAFRGSPEVTQAVPFKDDFNRATLGPDYHSIGGHWRIADGQLYSPGVGNNPLWLKARLPADARIAFDVRSEGRDGDIKFEAFGDGRNHESGYIFWFGGHHNRETRILKRDERALSEQQLKAQLTSALRPYLRLLPGFDGLLEQIAQPIRRWQARRDLDRLEAGTYYGRETPVKVERLDLTVVKGRTYHVVVTKKGELIRFELDGQLALELRDRAPLSGSGHDRFGFSSWQNDTWFDNLKIDPL